MSKIEEQLEKAFVCRKCKQVGAHAERLSMSGTGISRMLDIQPYKYIYLSCNNCGFTEVYDLKTLEGKKDGLGDVLDIIFSLD